VAAFVYAGQAAGEARSLRSDGHPVGLQVGGSAAPVLEDVRLR
jgi:hypothetical protein